MNYATGWLLIMQTDGNLVLIAPGDNPTFNTGTHGDANTYAIMQ